MDLNQNELAMLLEKLKRRPGPLERRNNEDWGNASEAAGSSAIISGLGFLNGMHRDPFTGRSKAALALGALGALGTIGLGAVANDRGRQARGWRKAGDQLFNMNKAAAARESNPDLRKELLRAILAQSQGLR